MSNLLKLSPRTRQLQLQLILIVLLLITGCYCLCYWASVVEFAFWGATAQASVIGVGDPYNSGGYRVTSPRIDYQYIDAGAKGVCYGSYYAGSAPSTPTLGQTFTVKYLPNHADSSCLPGDHSASGLLCATIPFLILCGLGALSIRRGEWIF